MYRRLTSALLAMAALAACGQEQPSLQAPASSPADAAAPAIPPVPPLDYELPASWLCRPELADACQADATVTQVLAGGAVQKRDPGVAGEPQIDCFYVYPTISNDPAGNADATPGAEEQEVVRQQFAHFAGLCRQFAPVYRQATLTALRQLRAGESANVNREMAYADVRAAWRHYVASDNAGRGVVLIGHDQGAGVLTRLIAAEIDGKPEQDRLISAILPGADVEVPQNSVVGGSFSSIPLCTSGQSVGCVIAWSAFRAEAPPPVDSFFGRAATMGMKVACVNPAQLDGNAGILKPYLPASRVLFDELAAPAPWTASPDAAPIETPFVALPDLVSAQCINREGASYLAVTVNADPTDPRTDTINGDVVVNGAVRPQWGLHLFDMHLAMGNLVNLVRSQSAAWLEQHAAAAPLPTDLQKQ